MKPTSNPAPPPVRPKVLIVDDEPVILQLLSETLNSAGYEATVAGDAQQGLERLKGTEYALILSDNQMPGMRGLEFFSKTRELQPFATRILITGIVDVETLLSSINTGELFRFVIKPWVREELLATVRNGIQRHELLRENERLHIQTRQRNQQLQKANAGLEESLKREIMQARELDRLNQALNGNLERSVELSVKTLQTFYPTLGSRARKAHQACSAMATSLGMSGRERLSLEIAAKLHDIGLLGVPRELIRRWQRSPASLAEAEVNLIRSHPVLGQELVKFVGDLEDVGTIIRSHHECYDGTGYPDRLGGADIPPLARWLAAAVAFTEKEGTDEDRRTWVRQLSGKRLDPEAVRLLLRCCSADIRAPGQREVLLQELSPGMVLAGGLYTSGGMLLMPEGQVLNRVYIDKIMSHHEVSPIKQSLLVYC